MSAARDDGSGAQRVKKRVHPITIVESIYKQLFLLLIPLLRGLLSVFTADSLSDWLYGWIGGAWMDILVLIFILSYSLLNWCFQFYTVDEHGLTVYKGILIKRQTAIPCFAMSTLMRHEPFYLRPFKAVHVYADTDAGSIRRADCQITVSRSAASMLAASPFPSKPAANQRLYRPKWYDIGILSIFVSSTFTGAMFLVAFFGKGGDVFGRDFQDVFLNRLEGIARWLSFIPEAAALLAIVIFLCWLIGAVHSFLCYINFSAMREEKVLRIRYGWLSIRRYSLRTDAVNYLDLRQTIVARLLGLYIVFIQCAGYAKNKDEHAVLIPAANRKAAGRYLRLLLPEFRQRPRQIKPPPGSIVRYAMMPFWCSLLIPTAAWILSQWFADFRTLILFFGLMATLPFVWLLVVRIVDCSTEGIAVSKHYITLYYAVGYAFHTVIVPREKINYIRIRSSIFQKWSGNCDLLVYTYSEIGKRHRIGNLRISEVRELLEKNGLLSPDDDLYSEEEAAAK